MIKTRENRENRETRETIPGLDGFAETQMNEYLKHCHTNAKIKKLRYTRPY
jgi:hypothetical protein